MPGIRSLFGKVGNSSKKAKLLVFLFIFLLLVIPLILYSKRPTPKQQAVSEIQSIVASLSKKVDLPSGTPSVYTVKDVTKLKGESFFANAKNGDKVLVYVNAKKAYLYRPTDDKLIEVAFYNPPEPTKAVAGASTSEATSPTVSPTPTLTRLPTSKISPTPSVVTPTSTPTPTFSLPATQ